MKRSVYWQNRGRLDFDDSDYLASGGEADVFRKGDWAFKLYHDRGHVLPAAKLRELDRIRAANVLLPRAMLYDLGDRAPVGFAMPFVDGGEALVKFFAPGYRRRQGIDGAALGRLVAAMRQTLEHIHRAGCLVVDCNEMNILLAAGEPYFIDTDSYQTPTHPASALSPAIRDPKARAFSEASDWFAFGILVFQLYTGIHPFKGAHPDYAAGDLQRRMDDGVSVFHPGVRLPPASGGFRHIPPTWLDWFKALFQKGERRPPPDGQPCRISAPLAAAPAAGTADLHVTEEWSLPAPILAAFGLFRGIAAVSADTVWLNGQPLARGLDGRRTLVGETDGGQPVLAVMAGETVTFRLPEGGVVDRVAATGWFCRDGTIYTLDGRNLVSHRFTQLGGRVVRLPRIEATTRGPVLVGDGLVLAPMLGRTWLWWPRRPGEVLSLAVPALDGYRLLHARGRGAIAMITAERRGSYFRFLLLFAADGPSYRVSKEAIECGSPNFAVLPGGICAHLPEDGRLVLFREPEHTAAFHNDSLAAAMPLFAAGGQIHLIDQHRICRLSTTP